MKIAGFTWIGEEKYGIITPEQTSGEYRGEDITALAYLSDAGPCFIGSQEFQDCKQLREIRFQPGLISIGEDAFQGCSSLTSVVFPYTLQCVHTNAFGDVKLRMARFEEGVQMLCALAFRNGIKSGCVHLPVSLKYIHESAFDMCRDVVFHVVKGTYACDRMRELAKQHSDWIIDEF